ncbi:MAG: extracellular catalytic domain type 1 short-chain-length polyhydroxyalkanoate depolymerase [Sphingomicrobium sp.]
MRRLSTIVSRLTASSRAMQAANSNDDGRLGHLTGFGSNPGELDARTYAPTDAPTGLVVVLHGCTQTASTYDKGSGWSQLAERHGFAVLFPQQRRANNPNLCFNWFLPGDARRGRGEAASIAQMVEHVAGRYGLDRSQTFITGLSAGGAMTSVMLASYPELFAGGAVIAGLPFASANTLPETLERMRGQGAPPRRELAARAMAAADHTRHGPTLSVWHGTHDTIVDRSNATAIVDQWRDLHGLGSTGGTVEIVDGHRREAWSDAQGRVVIEKYDVQGMGHGTPLDTGDSESFGTAGPHMLDAGICSTRRIASFWGLAAKDSVKRGIPRTSDRVETKPEPLHPSPPRRPGGPGAVIEDALRAAGLMS